MNGAVRFSLRLILVMAVFSCTACSAQKKSTVPDEHLIKEDIPRSPKWNYDTKPPASEPAPPPFASLSEDIVPLKTKTVNIVLRDSTLSDVLHILADATGLNLMVDKDVNLDQRVTLSLKNALAEDALKIIFSSLDCYYTIDNNLLKVEAMGTRIFELGHPALVNTFSMDVGGDIISSSGTNGLKGTISLGSKADGKAYDFWTTMEKSLEEIMGKQEAQNAPAAGSTAAKTPRQTESGRQQQGITVNRLTGTIIVTASRRTMEKVERYLNSVRQTLNRQVMIEARIIEVQLSNSFQYGIDWAILEKAAIGSISGGFGSLNVATTALSDATAAAAAGSNFQVGVASANFQGLLTALQTQGTVNILSNPKINVMNGHASILTVGTNTSFISKVSTTTTATAAGNSITFTPETASILSGLIIGIIPYISETGEITLNITPITSNLTSLQNQTFGSAGNQLTITIPTVALREMTTTVKIWDGQTVIIGGLISKQESDSEEKVPFLGSIPYLGKLFTRINKSESRSELVLLLRPRIVDNQ